MFEKVYPYYKHLLDSKDLMLISDTNLVEYQIVHRPCRGEFNHWGCIFTLENPSVKLRAYLFVHLLDTGIEFWVRDSKKAFSFFTYSGTEEDIN